MLKDMTKENFIQRYKDYNTQVQEYMRIFADSLVEKYQEIPDVFVVTLDVIAGNLTIMTSALKDLVSGQAEIVGKDNYRGEKKSTQLTAFLASQSNVAKLVEKFGWTPLGKSKIRENTDATDVAKYLESLTK